MKKILFLLLIPFAGIAQIKIKDLPVKNTFSQSDILIIGDSALSGNYTKKITIANFKANYSLGGVTDTTSLSNRINLKLDTLNPSVKGRLTADSLVVGNAGTEGGSIKVNGINFTSSFKVSDIDGGNVAQSIFHKHSTTAEPLIIGARSYSDVVGHTGVPANTNTFTIHGSGWEGSSYKLNGSINFATAPTGTFSNTSSPGQVIISTTPNGSTWPLPAITANSDQSVTCGNSITASSFIGTATGNYKSSDTVSTLATKSNIATKQNGFPGISQASSVTATNIKINYTTRKLYCNKNFDYFTDVSGVTTKKTYIANDSFPAFTNTSGWWYFFIDRNGIKHTTQTSWTVLDFDTIATVYRIRWNASLPSTTASVIESQEIHSNSISADDHQWYHLYGSVWEQGLVCTNNTITAGSPGATGANSVISLSTGTIMDDNLDYTVTNSAVSADWNQDMGSLTDGTLDSTNSGKFKLYYTSAGLSVERYATHFPFAFNTSTGYIQYITTGGVFTDVTPTAFVVQYIWASADKRNGKTVRSTSSGSQYTSLTSAQSVSWLSMQGLYPLFAGEKDIKPLYKLIYEVRSAYSVGAKHAVLRQIDDLREAIVQTSTSATGVINATNVVTTAGPVMTATNLQSNLDLLGDAAKKNTASTSTINTGTDSTTVVTPLYLKSSNYVEFGDVSAPIKQNVTITHTGTTNETKVFSVKIPAGTMQANDILEYVSWIIPGTGTGNRTCRVYFNTSDAIGGVLTATYIFTTASVVFRRNLTFKNSLTTQEIIPQATTNLGNQDATSYASSNIASVSINFANDVWFVLSIQLATAGDNVSIYSINSKISR